MTIQYSLQQSHLTSIPGEFTARIDSKGTVGINELANDVADTNLASAEEVKAIIAATCSKIEKHLLEGRRVQLGGIVNIGTSIRGTFSDPASVYDPEVNSVEVTASAGSRVKKYIGTNALVEKVNKPVPAPHVMMYKDINSGTSNSDITDGGVGQINGVDLDFDSADPDQGVFVTDAAGGPTPETKVTLFQKHTPSEIVFVVPDIALYTDIVLVVRQRKTPTGPIVSGQSATLSKA